MDARKTHTFVNQLWDKSIVPELCEYIKVPNKSPMFDHDWENHGYMDEAAEMLAKWCNGFAQVREHHTLYQFFLG